MSLETILLIATILYLIFGAYCAKTLYENSPQDWIDVFFAASCVIFWFPYTIFGNVFFKDKG